MGDIADWLIDQQIFGNWDYALEDCVTPGKKKFESREAAQTFAETRASTAQLPYPCECGHWHLSHKAAVSRAERDAGFARLAEVLRDQP